MRAQRCSGFGLVELLVALTILGAGVLTVAGTALIAARRMHAAELHQEAVLTASAILDSLAFAGPPVPGGSRVLGPLEFSWSAETAGAGAERVSLQVRSGGALLLQFTSVVAPVPVEAAP